MHCASGSSPVLGRPLVELCRAARALSFAFAARPPHHDPPVPTLAVDDGEPRHMNDPANLPFMEAIMRGQLPAELDPGDPNVQVGCRPGPGSPACRWQRRALVCKEWGAR